MQHTPSHGTGLVQALWHASRGGGSCQNTAALGHFLVLLGHLLCAMSMDLSADPLSTKHQPIASTEVMDGLCEASEN